MPTDDSLNAMEVVGDIPGCEFLREFMRFRIDASGTESTGRSHQPWDEILAARTNLTLGIPERALRPVG